MPTHPAGVAAAGLTEAAGCPGTGASSPLDFPALKD